MRFQEVIRGQFVITGFDEGFIRDEQLYAFCLELCAVSCEYWEVNIKQRDYQRDIMSFAVIEEEGYIFLRVYERSYYGMICGLQCW